MRSQLVQRLRSRKRGNSLIAVPPPRDSGYYLPELEACAARILYRSPLPSKEGLPVYILNAAAFPDTYDVDYDSLLPYVLQRLPREDQLLDGQTYEVVFFAGGQSDGSTSVKKDRPGWPWFIQAYNVLPRALRKRIQKLYIVHERAWVRILVEMFSTIASPKFRRKIEHVSTLSQLALFIDIQDLLIPPSAYLYDRQLSSDIHVPYSSGPRAFGARNPLPKNAEGKSRLPRILRETSTFLLLKDNIRVEGLFRIPAHAKQREIVKEAYDRGQKYIIWKDNRVTLPVPLYPRADASQAILQEIDPSDAYGVHLAAGLIKLWYAELREPVFPGSCYATLRQTFNGPGGEVSLEELQRLISPSSEFSVLPALSRQLLARHLLPLISDVAAYEGTNKMNADNLAVCFSPALVHGDDPMEDAKISSIVRKILASAAKAWPVGLRDACGVTKDTFQQDLQQPDRVEDYEDPPESTRNIPGSPAYYEAQQQSGIITMTDNDVPTETPLVWQRQEVAPLLPPRPLPSYHSDTLTAWSEATSAPKRKPAPALPDSQTQPPRYSTIITQDSENVTESPTGYTSIESAGTVRGSVAASASFASDELSSKLPSKSVALPQIEVPKRKAVTSESLTNEPQQIESSHGSSQKRSASENHAALSSIIAGQAAELVKRKPVTKSSVDSLAGSSPVSASSDGEGRRVLSQSAVKDDNGFAKPTWAASSRKPLVVNTLARGVVPTSNSPNQQQLQSLPPPSYVPKARTPSPGLLDRMPSFESTKSSPTVTTPGELRVPGRLNLKKPSVEDLRKLYEERTDTAKTLVEVGNESGRKGSKSSQQSTG